MRDLTKLVKEFIIPLKLVLNENQTIEEAVNSIRGKHIDEKILYFYVIDDKDHLKGVVSARTLLLRDPGTKLSEIMNKKVVCLQANQTLHEAMESLTGHRLLALPVVDAKDRLLGVIDVELYMEESVRVRNAKASNQVFQILGITIEEGKLGNLWQTYWTRMRWISCNIIGGTACAIISLMFEHVLLKVIILAMFIPLILTLSESISMQSMTQSLELLRDEKFSWKRTFQRCLNEWKVIAVLAISCGLIVGTISLCWGGGINSALTIGTGLTCSILVSASIGALIPILLHAKRFDPRVAAGPVILMFTDVVTTATYLGLGTWWLL